MKFYINRRGASDTISSSLIPARVIRPIDHEVIESNFISLPHLPISTSLWVDLNGQVLLWGHDYILDGSKITFDIALNIFVGGVLQAHYQYATAHKDSLIAYEDIQFMVDDEFDNTYLIDHTPLANSLDIFLNGITLSPFSHYTVTAYGEDGKMLITFLPSSEIEEEDTLQIKYSYELS